MLAHGGTPDEQVALITVVSGLWIGWAGVSRIRNKGFPRLPLGGAWCLAVVGGIVVVAGLTLPRQFMRPNAAPQRRSFGSASRFDRNTGDRPAYSGTDGVGQPGRGRDDARRRHDRRHGEHDAHARHRPHPPVARWQARLHDVWAGAARGRERSLPGRAHARGGVRRRRPRAVRSPCHRADRRSRSEAGREARRTCASRPRHRRRGHARVRRPRGGAREPRELGPGGQRARSTMPQPTSR